VGIQLIEAVSELLAVSAVADLATLEIAAVNVLQLHVLVDLAFFTYGGQAIHDSRITSLFILGNDKTRSLYPLPKPKPKFSLSVEISACRKMCRIKF
jgi:hypothetical protein